MEANDDAVREFFIPVKCIAKQSFRYGSNGGYTKAHVKVNAKDLALFARGHAPPKPWSGPIKLDVIFQFRWRKNESKAAKLADFKWKNTRPDRGNLLKQIEDVLEQVGFYEDDAQICDGNIRKVWTDVEGVLVRLEKLHD